MTVKVFAKIAQLLAKEVPDGEVYMHDGDTLVTDVFVMHLPGHGVYLGSGPGDVEEREVIAPEPVQKLLGANHIKRPVVGGPVDGE